MTKLHVSYSITDDCINDNSYGAICIWWNCFVFECRSQCNRDKKITRKAITKYKEVRNGWM